MNLRNLSDEVLLAETEKLVKCEREILTKLLHHLKEIEQRRLFSKLKYQSLYDYAVRRLGYSEDQAYRRISAMKLLKEIPELEKKIKDGSLSLTQIGLAQTYFRREAKSENPVVREQKIAVLQEIEEKSSRDSEKILLRIYGGASTQSERIRPVDEKRIEIKFLAGQELELKIKKLRGIFAHSHPNITLEELFNKLCDLGLEKVAKTAAPRDALQTKSAASVRREVRRKAGSCCQNCGSHYALEIDHIRPRVLGGDDSPKNLRLLCRSCNQRAAIEKLGQKKMDRYLN